MWDSTDMVFIGKSISKSIKKLENNSKINQQKDKKKFKREKYTRNSKKKKKLNKKC